MSNRFTEACDREFHESLSALERSTHALRTIADVLPEDSPAAIIENTAVLLARQVEAITDRVAPGRASEDDATDRAYEAAGRARKSRRRAGYPINIKAAGVVATGNVQDAIKSVGRAKETYPTRETFEKEALLQQVTEAYSVAPSKRGEALTALARDIIELVEGGGEDDGGPVETADDFPEDAAPAEEADGQDDTEETDAK